MRPIKRLFSRPAPVFILAVGILSACTVVVEQPRPGPDPSRPQMCTMEYVPVCGERGNQRRTFSNSCMARADGFRVVSMGECRREPEPQACTREFAPVCAVRGRQRETFSNSCMARADGFRVIHPGRCG